MLTALLVLAILAVSPQLRRWRDRRAQRRIELANARLHALARRRGPPLF